MIFLTVVNLFISLFNDNNDNNNNNIIIIIIIIFIIIINVASVDI